MTSGGMTREEALRRHKASQDARKIDLTHTENCALNWRGERGASCNCGLQVRLFERIKQLELSVECMDDLVAMYSEDLATERQNALSAVMRERESKWRLLSTAPKDGRHLALATKKGGVHEGYFLDNSHIKAWPWKGWKLVDQSVPINTFEPTAWQPLPAPPRTPETPDGE